MRRYWGRTLDDLARRIFEAEIVMEDALGDAVFLRTRIAGAVERFNTRKDDWATATAVAAERSKKQPSCAEVYKIYIALRKNRLDPPEEGKLRPTFEALEGKRRSAERDRVKEIRKRKGAESKPKNPRKR